MKVSTTCLLDTLAVWVLALTALAIFVALGGLLLAQTGWFGLAAYLWFSLCGAAFVRLMERPSR